MAAHSMEQIVSLCKRRGFVFQSAEIYGGIQGVYDFGPLGVELKNNLKAAWWRSLVHERDDIEGLDASILTHREVLRYSGHEDTFTDPLVDCRDCKSRWRADHLTDGRCPQCGSAELTDPRPFNLMFKTNMGPVEDASSFAYLRPETAQGIFTNFKNVLDSTSRRLPFGIAQIGKAFRNEVTPRNFIFRVREFEQMELEFFVAKGTDEDWHDQWLALRLNWWQAQGLSREHLTVFDVPRKELSHYSKRTLDILYRFPHGEEELEGIANRTDFDLGSHSKRNSELGLDAKVIANQRSNAQLRVRDLANNEWVVPYVIEPSMGVERGVLAILAASLDSEDLGEGNERTVLRLKPHLAPIKVAVLPLKRNHEDIMRTAQALRKELMQTGVGRIFFEDSGNIGKGYRRHDEVGTPLVVTVDFETIEGDGSVTLRDRDTMAQKRYAKEEIAEVVREYYAGA